MERNQISIYFYIICDGKALGFLIVDLVTAVKMFQKTSDSYYNVEKMIKALTKKRQTGKNIR